MYTRPCMRESYCPTSLSDPLELWLFKHRNADRMSSFTNAKQQDPCLVRPWILSTTVSQYSSLLEKSSFGCIAWLTCMHHRLQYNIFWDSGKGIKANCFSRTAVALQREIPHCQETSTRCLLIRMNGRDSLMLCFVYLIICRCKVHQ